MFDASGLEILEPAECFRLLTQAPIGRIVFTDRALPAVQPVNFAVDDESIVIRTGIGSKLAAAARNAVVAFEADDVDPDYHRGWSVTVVGHAHMVTDPEEIRVLMALPLRPWAPGTRDRFVRVAIEMIHGRRIVPPAQSRAPVGLESDTSHDVQVAESSQ